MSPAPPPPAAPRRPSHSLQESLAYLASVLPARIDVHAKALQQSEDAFALVDRWCGLRCVEALQLGEIDPATESASAATDFPFAELLTTHVKGQQWTGLYVVKALVLAGYAFGQQEVRLAVEIASICRRRNRSNWDAVLPPRIPPDAVAELATAIELVVAHVDQKLRAGSSLPRAAAQWLIALRRWCELLERPPRAPRWKVPSAPVEVDAPPAVAGTSAAEDDGDAGPEFEDDFSEPGSAGSDAVDEPDPTTAPEAPDRKRRSVPRRAGLAESIGAGEARRLRTGFLTALENQRLPWCNAELSPDDAAALRDGLTAALRGTDAVARDVAGLVALSHLSGQRVEQVLDLAMNIETDVPHIASCKYLMRRVPRQKDAWIPAAGTRDFLRPKAEGIPLLLPLEVTEWLRTRVGDSPAESLAAALGLSREQAIAQVRGWLMELRQRTRGLQTIARIERWLANALFQMNRDHVPPFLLCAANDALPCPAAYYRAYAARDLARLHHRCLQDAGWNMPPIEEISIEGWVGSDLNLTIGALRELSTALRNQLQEVALDESQPLHVRHNAREAHEVLLLMFQTLHRAVSDPLESLRFIDLDAGRIVIDDKRQGDARAHRVIPLPRLGVHQCDEQIEHVLRLVALIREVAPDTADRLLSMIEWPERRAAPFRFFLSKDLRIVNVTPATLKLELRSIWPLPLNTGRHFIPTWLLEQGVSDDSLCSLCGHTDIGTQNLSIYSPLTFDELFKEVVPLLDALARELGLASIPSFLPPLSTATKPRGGNAAPDPMLFGSEARAERARLQREALRAEVKRWVTEQLAGRAAKELNQEDVSALFAHARQISPNDTHRSARDRYEALREELVALMRTSSTLRLDLPAVPLSLTDVSHICPPDCLESARRLDRLKACLRDYWSSAQRAWELDGSGTSPPDPTAVLLTLIISSLVLDPEAWPKTEASAGISSPFRDESGHTWIRVGLVRGNSRLHPIDPDLAELLSAVDPDALRRVTRDDIVRFADGLGGRSGVGVKSFSQLLQLVQSGVSADVPGLVLGYAAGTLGSVSPENMCLERQGGQPPTKAAVAAVAPPKEDETAADALSDVASDEPAAAGGRLSELAGFRRLMAAALRAMATPGPTAGASSPHDKRVGPMKRLVRALDSSWDDLAGSPKLPAVCILASRWIHHLAKHGQADNTDYASKTLLNYWYSWGLRVVEEFGDLDPRHLLAAELEDIYLQMVEEAEVENRQHLYPPMRNLHRYLVRNHGVVEIDWSELRDATEQGQRRINANVVHVHEYRRALSLLGADSGASVRIRAMQCAALVLVFRGGLRVGECLGLQHGDVYLDARTNRWRVRLRGNRYRKLKTDNARRVVIELEALEPAEHAALLGWCEHAATFAEEHGAKPLFSRAATGDQRAELFPRQTIALRLGQALRAATGDPTIRVHHCRHAYPTRLLSIAANSACREDPLGTAVQTQLTSADEPSRRVVWAIATMMGHASPRTTMGTYFHAGHEWLRTARPAFAIAPVDSDSVEWFAFCCGTRRKTMQRALQRARGEDRVAMAVRMWSRVPRLGDGPRVELPSQLSPLNFAETPVRLSTVDRIIDHARRFNRADGLAARLYLSEATIERVLAAAAAFAANKRKATAGASQWWIDVGHTRYSPTEASQVNAGLRQLEALGEDELGVLADVIERCLIPSSRMLAIESEADLDVGIRALKLLVDDAALIELLVPAKLPKRPTAEQRREREELERRKAALMRIPYRAKKPRVDYNAGSSFAGMEKLRQVALRHGISTSILHGRVPGARADRHDRFRVGARFALRIHENRFARVRSAKVMTRILASAAVAFRAHGTPPVG